MVWKIVVLIVFTGNLIGKYWLESEIICQLLVVHILKIENI